MMTSEFIERIQAATALKAPLCIQGGATKRWYGQTPKGDILDTRCHTGIIDYDPSELVITARCGTPLAEIERTLATQNQMLAFEPPSFGADATIGGVVAAGLAGPRRAYAGGVRDFMLGAVLMNGRAERLVFGGQVMKNVAGYDVSRLLAGSMGSLGLLLELSIKVLPQPYREITLAFELPQDEALTTLNKWAGLPLPLSASSWESAGNNQPHDRLLVRLSGSEAATSVAQRQLGGEQINGADATDYWQSLREQTHAFFNDADTLWRLSVPSTTPTIDVDGHQLIEWGGAQRWLKHSTIQTEQLRQKIAALGGHATLFKSTEKHSGVFQPLAAPLMTIHNRLKTAFDPAGIFNPDRLY